MTDDASKDLAERLVEATRNDVIDIKKELRENNHSVRNHLQAQALQLSRIETQLQSLSQLESEIYGSSGQRGMLTRIQSLEDVKSVDASLFVTRIEFEPFKKLISGVVGLCLASIVAGMLALVIKKG